MNQQSEQFFVLGNPHNFLAQRLGKIVEVYEEFNGPSFGFECRRIGDTEFLGSCDQELAEFAACDLHLDTLPQEASEMNLDVKTLH